VQCDVHIDAGPTSLDPSQTSFFQAHGISTKINKGSIEILTKVHLIKVGDKVGSSEATLLGKLNVKPFEYGLVITKVYDHGDFFDAAVLSIQDEDLERAAEAAIQNIAAMCLALNYPTLASLPHSIINTYKENVLAFALGQEGYSFAQADKVRSSLLESRYQSLVLISSELPEHVNPAIVSSAVSVCWMLKRGLMKLCW
jgi:large subunit ribosomal protein LP0